MDPVLGIGIICGAPVMVAAGIDYVTRNTNDSKRTHQWVEVWEEGRNWLASVVVGEQEETPADTLDRFVELLTWTAAPVKGYCIGMDSKRKTSEYKRMYLTCIPVKDKGDGAYYRNRNALPKEGESFNPSLKEEVELLRKLETYCRSLTGQSVAWSQQLDAYIKAYAGHLLINYRDLRHDGFSDFWKKDVPGALKPGEMVKLMQEWDRVVQRHRLLEEEALMLCYRATKEKVTLNGLAIESATLAEEIVAARPANKELAVTAGEPSNGLDDLPLTESERELILQFRSRKEYLALTERLEGEVLIEKLTASAKVSTLEGKEDSSTVVAIAGENRALAQGGLGHLMGYSNKSEQEDMMKSLRADNLYLRQKSEEIESRATHA